MATIEEKIRANTAEILERARQTHAPPREAAVAMARSRVEEAMGYCRP
jgi:glutamate dehydrogenase/leucine dehydrogenase